MRRIRTDVAALQPGDWFFPLSERGDDLHAQIPEAIARGAAGVYYVPGRFDPAAASDARLEPVASLREGLFRVARERRALLRTRVVTIAGSNGKTTVKELLRAMLAASGAHFHASPENMNTKPALAAQILAMPEDCEIAVFEVGARRAGDFEIPLGFLQPEIAALLNVGSAHVGEFGSPERLLATKLSALKHPAIRTRVVPAKDERILTPAAAEVGELVSFGEGPTADLRVRHRGPDLVFSWRDEECAVATNVKLPAFGANAAAAIAIAKRLGLSREAIETGLRSFRGISSRFETLEWHGKTVVNDAFNASLESVTAGLRHFFELHPTGRRVVVLGDILELGELSDAIHDEVGRELLRLAKRDAPVLLVTVGAQARRISSLAVAEGWPAELSHHVANASEAMDCLRRHANDWEIAYLKSSKSVGLKDLFHGAAARSANGPEDTKLSGQPQVGSRRLSENDR